MRKILLACFSISMIFVIQAQGADLGTYKKIAENSINQMKSGKNIDGVIADQEKLINIGIQAISEHMKANPSDGKVLKLVKDNAKKLQSLSLAQIEEQWHDKGYLKAKGIDPGTVSEKSTVGSLMDSVVHPATVIIVLNQYKKDNDRKHLQQAEDELTEVIGHLSHIPQ